jgi:hypothetical protein
VLRTLGLLALMGAVMFAGTPVASAAQKLPFLSVKKAKRYMRTALRQDFGGSYTRGHAKYVDTCTRKPRLTRRPGRVRCQVGWRHGNFSYNGAAAIWLRWRDGSVRWWYAYSIAETDEQCVADGGSDYECVYVYNV